MIRGIVSTRPLHEWAICYTHLTLLISFLTIIFQFSGTYHVNVYHRDRIAPRHYLQYIHMVLTVISFGSDLTVYLLYWLIIYKPSTSFYVLKIIFDHGILWFLLLIDIFFFKHLPIYSRLG